MNTSALKNFAPATRATLLDQVSSRVDYLLETDSVEHRELSREIKQLSKQVTSKGKEALVNEVAYTWFNRFAAFRFMDAHSFHPAKVRVITAIDGFTQPEVLQQARSAQLDADFGNVDLSRIADLLSGRIPSASPENEIYRMLIIAACEVATEIHPALFSGVQSKDKIIHDLLLPSDLLSENSVLAPFRELISDDDCADVEILGWLYQFYIAEKKDEVMKRKKAVATQDIPYVTQLFTPNWIVRYMVENSLGRLWLQNRPQSSLAEKMSYYIPEEEGQSLAECRISSPEEIKILDPAVGSGHILSYAFELLSMIYEEEGYTPSEIPALILEHNLYGIDICPRAAQLAELSLLFKARKGARRFFARDRIVHPNILTLEDISFEQVEIHEFITELDLTELFGAIVIKQLHQFSEATTFGSLIQPVLDTAQITEIREAILTKDLNSQLFLKATQQKVLIVLAQAEMLQQRYHCVIANPPYMGGKQMNAAVKNFAKENYKDAKSDLFAMFIDRGFSLVIENGYNAMVTMQSWMFLSSFESFRENLLTQKTILSMAHLGARGFDSISGEVVQTTAFVALNGKNLDYEGAFFRLTEGKSEKEKKETYLKLIKELNEAKEANA